MWKRKKPEETSQAVASSAAKILSDHDASPAEKSVAASALTQAPDRATRHGATHFCDSCNWYDDAHCHLNPPPYPHVTFYDWCGQWKPLSG